MEPVSRKLAAILSADVAGYSRLMADDHEATLATLTAYRDLFSRYIGQHRGRIVNAPGDAVLAEFGSVVDALACAAEIQRELAEKNAELPGHRKMEFRIGVNLGDVLLKDGALYGDGVNIAARLEALAEPGGICISGTAFEHVEGRLPLEYADLGEQTVKNIPKPVRAYKVLSRPGAGAHRVVRARRALGRHWRRWAIGGGVSAVLIAAGAAGTWWWLHRGAPPAATSATDGAALLLPDMPSIAVLPFVNMSGDPEQDYFSDGLTEDIITKLSYIRHLTVIARNSTFQYKGQSVDVRQVGQELAVRHVLEGSVRKTGDRMRVTAQLIEAKTGAHVWAEQWDRPLADDFAVQDEITQSILNELEVELVGRGLGRVYAAGPDNPKVLDYMRRGDRLQSEGKPAEARRWYEKAAEADPEYVEGIAAVGWAHNMEVSFGKSPNPDQSLREAVKWAEKALALDPDHPSPMGLLGIVATTRGELDEARKHLARALEIMPNQPDWLVMLAVGYNVEGRQAAENAIRLVKRALQLNPKVPPFWYWSTLGWAYMTTGQYEECIEPALKSIEMFPDWEATRIETTICYQATGRIDEAKAQAAEILRINPDFRIAEGNWLSKVQDQATREELNGYLRDAGLR